jgi:hypothetical protein
MAQRDEGVQQPVGQLVIGQQGGGGHRLVVVGRGQGGGQGGGQDGIEGGGEGCGLSGGQGCGLCDGQGCGLCGEQGQQGGDLGQDPNLHQTQVHIKCAKSGILSLDCSS